MKVSYTWLQTYFSEPLPSVLELDTLLSLHAFEIEGIEQVGEEWVIDVDVLPNRSSDCLSHRGIARELATLLARPLKSDPLREPLPSIAQSRVLTVEVENAELCPRYMATVMRGVTIGPSPLWLSDALLRLGQRSVNNVVDATNYVMFNLGQPLHAFDLGKLTPRPDGVRGIAVRAAREGERITLLGGAELTLSPRNLVIADEVLGDPLALAGVKGGTLAEIGPETVDIVLESANFQYVSVRKTSREFRLTTDASVRFQNEPVPELAAFAMRDVARLIEEIAGGVIEGGVDVFVGSREGMPIEVTLTEMNDLLGTEITVDEVERILVRFEWEFSRHEEHFTVTPPWERTDLSIKEDIIEEVGRVYGYGEIPSRLPKSPEKPPRVHARYYAMEKVRHALVSAGYSEVYTYVLADRGEVELENPLAADKSFLRSTLRPGLLRALEHNVHHAPYLGLDTVRLFEIGTVFTARGEYMSVSLGARAVRGKQTTVDRTIVKDIECLADLLGVKVTVKPEDGVAEFDLDALLPLLDEPEGAYPTVTLDRGVHFAPWSPYPYAPRDIAVWVPADTPAEEVLAVIVVHAPDLLVRHYQFDSFEKDGRTSYAWHLVFQAEDRTLTDSEVFAIMADITDALNAREDWEVR